MNAWCGVYNTTVCSRQQIDHWADKQWLMLVSTWAVAMTDVLKAEWNMTCVHRNAWCTVCVVFGQCGDHMSECIHAYRNVHMLHRWWPVYVTSSFQSNRSLQRTHHLTASCLLPGRSRVGQSSHTSRRTHCIHITSRNVQKLLEWSEHQHHDIKETFGLNK